MNDEVDQVADQVTDQVTDQAADQTVITNPWQALRGLTQARIALGRSGVSMPTSVQLEFQLAHARARDAVHLALDADALAQALTQDGYDCIHARSAARDRMHYLQRPDLGRKLDADSRANLLQLHHQNQQRQQRQQRQQQMLGSYDLALVIADGLSATAVARNAMPFLRALQAELVQNGQEQNKLSLAPTVIVQNGRVAIGDEIGEIWQARAVLVLIGERPGLSSPDSMGLYFSWEPKVGLTDAQRNCISNIRPAGLSYATAAYKLHYLLSEAQRCGFSGVALKDETLQECINVPKTDDFSELFRLF